MKKYLLAAAALLAAPAAQADVVTVYGAIVGSNWSVYFGSPIDPIDPLYIYYAATFDNSMSYLNDNSILNVYATNIPYDMFFTYRADSSTIILATAGVDDDDSYGCSHPESSACIFTDMGAPATAYFFEQSPAGGGGWVANTISSDVPGDVPEPAVWAMMIGGFGLVGANLRRRRITA